MRAVGLASSRLKVANLFTFIEVKSWMGGFPSPLNRLCSMRGYEKAAPEPVT